MKKSSRHVDDGWPNFDNIYLTVWKVMEIEFWERPTSQTEHEDSLWFIGEKQQACCHGAGIFQRQFVWTSCEHGTLTGGRTELERSEFAICLVDDLDGTLVVVMEVDVVHNDNVICLASGPFAPPPGPASARSSGTDAVPPTAAE